MSVNAVSAIKAASPNYAAAAQLQRDQQKLIADTRAKASPSVLAADRAAIALDQQA